MSGVTPSRPEAEVAIRAATLGVITDVNDSIATGVARRNGVGNRCLGGGHVDDH